MGTSGCRRRLKYQFWGQHCSMQPTQFSPQLRFNFSVFRDVEMNGCPDAQDQREEGHGQYRECAANQRLGLPSVILRAIGKRFVRHFNIGVVLGTRDVEKVSRGREKSHLLIPYPWMCDARGYRYASLAALSLHHRATWAVSARKRRHPNIANCGLWLEDSSDVQHSHGQREVHVFVEVLLRRVGWSYVTVRLF
jgi:hypothetical protein